MSSGTWTDTGASVTLPAGKYVVNGTVLFNSAANGQRVPDLPHHLPTTSERASR